MKAKDPELKGRIDAGASASPCAPPSQDLAARNEELVSVNRLLREKLDHLNVADDDLALSERRFRALTEKSADVITIADLQGMITYVSPNTQAVLGYAPGELQGQSLFHWVHADECEAAQTLFAQCAAQPGTVRRAEVRFATRAGDWRWLETVATNLTDDPAVGGIVLNSRDVTGRRAAEEELRRANRSLRALRNNSLAVVRAESESAYLREVCRIVKEDCGYALVWVGFAEDDAEKSVRPVAWAGFEEGYLDTLKLTWADVERGQGPTGTAIRTARTCRCLNMLTDPRFLPWREEAVKRGYASSIALPLISEGKAFGALMIYAREPVGFADVDEKMLTKLAGEFAYGIAMLRLRAATAGAEGLMRAREARLRLALDAGRLATWDWDLATGDVVWNEAHFRMLGYEPDGIHPTYQGWADRVHPDDRPAAEQAIRQAMEQGSDYGSEFRVCWPDGTIHWLEARGRFDRDAGGRAVRNYGVMQDVTERRLAARLSEALNAIHAAIHATPHVEQIMQYVITEATRALGCDTAAVSLRRANEWVVSYAHGFPEDVLGRKMSDADEPHALLAIQLQAPLAIGDAFADPRVNRGRMRAWGVRAVLVVPLLIRQEAVGVLFFNYQNAPQAFGSAHLDFAAKLSAAVSLALDNARLFSDIKTELSARKQAEEALQERDERIRQALLVSRSFAFEWEPATDRVTRSKDCGPILRLVGDAVETDTGAHYFQRVHAEDRERFVGLLQALTPAAPTYRTQYRILCPDGETVTLEEAGRAYFDADGRLERLAGISTDVTAREQAAAALRESRNQLSRAQEIAHLGSWELDLARNELTWSDETYRIFGLAPQEFAATYQAFLEHIHPEDRAAVDAAYAGSVRAGQEAYEIEHRIVRATTGEVRWVQEKCRHVQDAQGRIIRSTGMVLDITERKQAEDRLRQAKAELEIRVQERTAELRKTLTYNRGLIETSLDPFVAIGPDGRITDINTAAETATGRIRDALVGADFPDQFTEPDQARAGVQQVFREGWVRDCRMALRHRDGHATPVLFNAAVYRDEQNEAVGVIAALRDITAIQRAEEALKTERQRFFDVLEMLPAYVVLLAQDYTVPFANRTFRERFGESGGKRCYEFLFGRTEVCENCESYKPMQTHGPHRWEWAGPDGRIYDIHDFPFTDADGSPMVMEMGIDITDVKTARAALEQVNEALEQRVAARTAELTATNEDLTRFNRAMVDRELRMIELKSQINDLCRRAGQPPPYASESAEDSPI